MSSVLSNKVDAQSAPQQSTIVTVGAGNPETVPTYSMPRTLSAASASPVWMSPSNDAVSSLMAGNFFSQSLTNRLKGLGSALLDMVKSGTDSFSQSVTQAPSEAGAVAATSTDASSFPQANEQIVITTKSGVKVNITLSNQPNQLQVKMNTSGALSDDERAALAKLSDAFQDAVDGLTAKSPHLDLGALTQFDSTVLSSVDFHSSIALDQTGTQTVDFHADSATRKLGVDGPTGMVNVSVDMSDSSIWGNPQQRSAAIDSYLKQFDQAASRGNADKSLMSMFKDAFTQLNTDYAAPTSQRPAIMLAASDHAMLTGLADFNASISQTSRSSNPMHESELDTFSYQASQSTHIRGHSRLDRSISQQQQSQLNASYHLSLLPDVPLELGTDNKTQNYYYKQIDDSASTSTDIAYTKGRLSQASSTQSANQSTHVSKYELGKLTEDTTTPLSASLTTDILATLEPFLKNLRVKPEDMSRWEQTLSAVHDQILLKPNPSDLRTANLNLTARPQE